MTKRRERVFDLRLKGWSYRDIGDEVGVSAQTVMNDLRAEAAQVLQPLADELRTVESARLDQIEASAWAQHDAARAADHPQGALAALGVVLKVSEGRRKMLRLDLEEPAGVAQTRALEAASKLVAEVVGEVVKALADAATGDYAFRDELQEYGARHAEWLLGGRLGLLPVAPVRPDPCPPVVVELLDEPNRGTGEVALRGVVEAEIVEDPADRVRRMLAEAGIGSDELEGEG